MTLSKIFARRDVDCGHAIFAKACDEVFHQKLEYT